MNLNLLENRGSVVHTTNTLADVEVSASTRKSEALHFLVKTLRG